MQKKTTEITYVRNDEGDITKETIVETLEKKEEVEFINTTTCCCACDCVDDTAELIDGEFEVTDERELGILDCIMAGAGIASIALACVSIYKMLKK